MTFKNIRKDMEDRIGQITTNAIAEKLLEDDLAMGDIDTRIQRWRNIKKNIKVNKLYEQRTH